MDTPLLLPDMAVVQQIHHVLCAWFERTARDLPWRATRNPYHILVSEMMLQQTQVERVMPKYLAFLAAFPTVQTLAAAPLSDVIRLWAGLGYNRRAIYLHRIAQQVCTQYNGTFPRTMHELQALPGIGHYTAGAIVCFAFGKDVAFMDTNIRRVIQRLFGVANAPKRTTAAERTLLTLADYVLPPGNGWLWNQAVMELGALHCHTSAPTCDTCPVNTVCRAYGAWHQQFTLPGTQQNTIADVPKTQEVLRYPQRTSARQRNVAERTAPFVGSNRYYRGKIIDALRQLPPGDVLSFAELAHMLHDVDDERIEVLVAGLARDGLIVMVENGIRLP